MKAVIVSEFGGPEVLKLSDVPAPEPQRGEVRVEVKATALNRADVLQRKGHYPAPKDVPQEIPGLEFAGVVDEIADGVEGFSKGDRVFGLVAGGSYAQYVVVHHRCLARIPEKLSFTAAAAVPEAFITAYDAMVSQGGLMSGEWLLVHAVGSGVGTAALQLCNAIGARCIGTSRTKDKLDRAFELGLRHGIVSGGSGGNGDGTKFSSRVKEIAPEGVDVVLELIGGDYVSEDIECIANKGRIVVVGLLAGAKVEMNLALLLRKRAHMMGTTLRARPLEEKIIAAQLLAKNIVPMIESGAVKPIVDKVFEMSEAVAAHKYMESNDSFGKVVMKINE